MKKNYNKTCLAATFLLLAGIILIGCDDAGNVSISMAQPVKQVKHAGGPVPYENASDLAKRSVSEMNPKDTQERQIKRQLETDIIDLLACYDAQDRVNAANNLGELRKPQACDALVLAINDKVPAVQVAAIEALGWIGDKTTALPVAKKLAASQSRVRLAAAKAYGRLGNASNAKMLHPFFADSNIQVRTAAIRSAGALRARGAVQTLANVIAKDHSPEARAAAAGALGQIGTPGCFAPLTQALTDQNPQVRYMAIGALKSLNDKRAIKYLKPLTRDDDSAIASHAQGTIEKLSSSGK